METILLAVALFGLAFVGMAIGVILAGKDKELKGSCGGVGSNPDCCMACPDKPQCDHADGHGGDLDEQFAALANRGGASHPALAQAPGVSGRS